MSSQSKPVQQLTPFGHALAGALGGVFSNAVVYPLDTFVRSTYIKRTTKAGSKPKALSTIAELVLGAIAGALAQIFTIPVSVIATRQQVGRSVPIKRSKSTLSLPAAEPSPQVKLPNEITVEPSVHEEDVEPERDASFLAVAREIIEEDGVTGLWLGIHSSLVLTVNPAITYGVFERVKSIFTLGDPNVKLSPWGAFTVGALSKTLATVVTYPYIMAKVRVQAHGSKGGASDSKTRKYNGALDILKKVYKTEGLSGWYQGMSAQIIKAVLSQAFLFMSKDQFERYALIIMIAWQRLATASPA
ncbi:ADP/ATP carrier protein [Serendipita sp. 396]|nr:ADP/ATP carrier protein [Serendipita sp. 396]